MEPFIIPAKKNSKKQFCMSIVLCNYDKKYCEAIIMLDKKRNEPSRKIVGHRILATDLEALKAMLLEVAAMYPPKEDIEVRPHYRDDIIKRP